MRIDSRLQLSTRGLRGLWGLHGGVSPSSIITSIVGPPRYFSPCVQISIYFRNISIKFVKGKRNLKKMNQFQILHWDSYSTPQELYIYIYIYIFFFFFLGGVGSALANFIHIIQGFFTGTGDNLMIAPVPMKQSQWLTIITSQKPPQMWWYNHNQTKPNTTMHIFHGVYSAKSLACHWRVASAEG